MTLVPVLIAVPIATYEGCTDSATENTNSGTCPDTPRFFAYQYFSVNYFSKNYFTVCKPGS